MVYLKVFSSSVRSSTFSNNPSASFSEMTPFDSICLIVLRSLLNNMRIDLTLKHVCKLWGSL